MEGEPPATSRASRLLQEDAAQSSFVSPEAAHKLRQVFETREKLVNITQVALLDFKRQSPVNIKACVEVLLRLHRSILEAPDEVKFRKVSSKAISVLMHPQVHRGTHAYDIIFSVSDACLHQFGNATSGVIHMPLPA